MLQVPSLSLVIHSLLVIDELYDSAYERLRKYFFDKVDFLLICFFNLLFSSCLNLDLHRLRLLNLLFGVILHLESNLLYIDLFLLFDILKFLALGPICLSVLNSSIFLISVRITFAKDELCKTTLDCG